MPLDHAKRFLVTAAGHDLLKGRENATARKLAIAALAAVMVAVFLAGCEASAKRVASLAVHRTAADDVNIIIAPCGGKLSELDLRDGSSRTASAGTSHDFDSAPSSENQVSWHRSTPASSKFDLWLSGPLPAGWSRTRSGPGGKDERQLYGFADGPQTGSCGLSFSLTDVASLSKGMVFSAGDAMSENDFIKGACK